MLIKKNHFFIKKRISIFITVVMVLSAIPVSVLNNVDAASGHTHDNLTFSTAISSVSALSNLCTKGGSGYLSADITLAGSQMVVASGKTVNLCLNGHIIVPSSSKSTRLFENNGTLNIYDCNKTTTHNFLVDSNGEWTLTSTTSGAVAFESLTSRPAAGKIITLKGGCLADGCQTDSSGSGGGGCIRNIGTLNLYGGNLVGNGSSMNAGTTMAYGWGGAINNTGTITIYDGVCMCGNLAHRGGGAINNNGTLTMKGGIIAYNTTLYNWTGTEGSEFHGGGGIRIDEGYKLTISGNPKIYGNIAGVWNGTSSSASNIYLRKSTSLIDCSGGVTSGANINVGSYASFTGTTDSKIAVNAKQAYLNYIHSDNNSTAGVIYCNGSKDYDINTIAKSCSHTHASGTVWLTTKAAGVTLHTHTWSYALKSGASNVIAATCTCSTSNSECTYKSATTANRIKYVTLSASSATYTGNAISATVKADSGFPVSVSASKIVYYTDSTLKTKTTSANSGASANGKAPVKPGTYYAAITVGGKTASKSFTINKIALTDSNVTLSATSFNADGSAKSPTVIVKASVNGTTQTLTKGTDYTISGDTSKTEVNSYTLKVTGAGNFSGTISKTWKIVKSNSSVSVAPAMATPQTITYDGKAHNTITFTGTVTGGTIKYQAVTSGSNAPDSTSTNWTTSIPSVTNANSYDIYYMISGNAYYNDKSATKIGTYTVNKANQTISAPTLKTSLATQVVLNSLASGQGNTQYAYSTSNTAPTSNWQTTTTFTGLTKNTAYYFFAKYLGNSNYNVVTSTGTKITTPNLATSIVTGVTAITGINDTGIVYDEKPVETSDIFIGTPTIQETAKTTTYEWEGVAPTDYTKSTTAPTIPGTYKLIITVTSDNYTGSFNIPFTIKKANQTIKSPTLKSSLATQVILNAIEDGHGSTEYAYNTVNEVPTSNWQSSLTFKGLTKNKTYYFFARYAGNECYNAITSTGTEITTPDITTTTVTGVTTITGINDVGIEYDGNLIKTTDIFVGDPVINETAKSIVYEWEGVLSTSYTKTTQAPTIPGSYQLIITVTSDNYVGVLSIPFKIINANSSVSVEPTMIETTAIVYDGVEHETIIPAGAVIGGTIKYITVTSGEPSPTTNTDGWSENVPKIKDAGTYDIYYMITATTYYNDTVPRKIGTFTINKADQTISAPSLKSSLATQVILNAIEGGHGNTEYAYNISNVSPTFNWQSSPIFTGLNKNTTYYFFTRYSGNNNYNTVISTSTAITTPDLIEMQITGVTPVTGINNLGIIYDGNCIEKSKIITGTPVLDNSEEILSTTYEWESVDTTTYVKSTNAPIYPGVYRLIVTVTTDNYIGRQNILFKIIAAEQSAIDESTVVMVGESIYGKADGKILGVMPDYEYSLDGTTYIPCIGTEITGLTAGKVYLRKAAKLGYNPSPAVEVTIPAGDKIKLSVPETANYTITALPDAIAYGGSTILTLKTNRGWSIAQSPKATIGGEIHTFTDDGSGNYVCEISNITDKDGLKVTALTGIEDTTPSTASIAMGTNYWNTFLNTITFGLFFKETQTVTVDTSDEGSGVDKVRYYISNNALTVDEVKNLENSSWTDYTSSGVSLNPSNKYVVYFKVTDKANNTTYVSTNGIEVDTSAPAVVGIIDDETYYDLLSFSVTDTSANVTVKVDGSAITATEGSYKVEADDKEHLITIQDGAGNEVSYTVTLTKSVTAFNQYKLNKKNVASGLAVAGDSDECKNLIVAAKIQIDNTAYDESTTLDNNKRVIDEIINQLSTNLYNQRGTDKETADAAAAYEVVNKFSAIGSIEYSSTCKEKIDIARQAYEALTDDQKAKITANQLKVLTDSEAAYAAAKKIDAIGTVEYSSQCKAKIDAARAVYDALTDDQKSIMTQNDKSTLIVAENTYASILESINTAKANAVLDHINSIGAVEYTPECNTKINAARSAYNALTDEQKALIPADKLSVLTGSEAAYAVAKKINEIGAIEYTSDCGLKIAAARSAYNTLTAEQKALIATSQYNELTDSETVYAVAGKIVLITTVLQDMSACKAKIDIARAAYDDLSSEQKAKMLSSQYSTLTDAESIYNVAEKIASIGEVEYTDACKARIDAARDAYDALTNNQKSIVGTTGLTALINAENAYATLKEIADLSSANEVIDIINTIGAIEYTTDCKERIDEARAAYNLLTSNQKSKITDEQLKVLTDSEEAYLDLENKAQQEKQDILLAKAVIEKIDSIAVVLDSIESGAKIEAARIAYNALSLAQRAKITLKKLNILKNAEKLFENLKTLAKLKAKNDEQKSVTASPTVKTFNKYEDMDVSAGQIKDITCSQQILAEENSYNITVVNDDELEKILGITDEEKSQGVNTWITMYNAADTMPKGDKNEIKKADTDYSVGDYLAVTLYKKVGNREPVKVTKLNGKLKLTMTVPEKLIKKGRKYGIVRVYEGNATVLDGTYNETNHTFTFETDQFSSYALIYRDFVGNVSTKQKLKSNNSDSNSASARAAHAKDWLENNWMWLLLIPAVLGSLVIIFPDRRRKEQDAEK